MALARPETPAFLTALAAVGVGTGTTVVFPFAIGKCMDAMTLGGGKKKGGGGGAVGEEAAAGPDLAMTAHEFLEASFGQLPPWVLDVIPPDAAPLSVLSTGLVGVRCVVL
jgi:hypothetical protein